MIKKIRSIWVTVLAGAMLSSVLIINQAVAADWSDVFKKVKAKHTGFEQEVKDMSITQEMKIVTADREITSNAKVFKKGGKFRIDSAMQVPGIAGGMNSVVIFDGKSTWMISPVMGKRKLAQRDENKYQTEENWLDLISDKAEITGSEKIGNQDCYVVAVNREGESSFTRVWIGKKNLILVKAENKGREGKMTVWVFSDFRKIKKDYEMPYKTEMYTGGKLFSVTLVKSIAVNNGLPDSLFDAQNVN